MFHPPFCPNKDCSHHIRKKYSLPWYVLNGHYKTICFGLVQRYKCKHCKREFSSQTFHIDYFAKKKCNYETIYNHIVSSAGNRDISRALKVSPNVIQNRIGRLSRQCAAVHSEIMSLCDLKENLTADGLESFCYSQYFPNNIHLLAGAESRVVYYLNGETIRRKGRMTAAQKERRKELEEEWKVRKGGIRKSFKEMLFEMKDLYERSSRNELTLYSDEKYDYVLAFRHSKELRMLLESGEWVHHRTNSKVARTIWNMLFASNYIDREVRKGLSDHHRETVQWAKDMSEMFKRLIIFIVHHNVKMPFDVKKERKDDRVHWEVAGVSKKVIANAWKGIFRMRRFYTHIELPDFWKKIWFSEVRTPLDKRGGFKPVYLYM